MESNSRQQSGSSRQQRLTNEVATIVASRDVVSHQQPTLADHRNHFPPGQETPRQSQISVELWKNADSEKNKLFHIMEQVRIKLNKKSQGQYENLDLRSCKWEEVMSEVTATSQRWKSTPNSTAKAQRCLEKLGRDSGAFQAWLGVLPAGDYGASICGVFKLAVGAASRYVSVEDYIFDALSELPEIMESAQRYITIYKDTSDHLLERKTFDLYLVVLKALNHIMQFFADSSTRKLFEPLVKQTSYKMALTKCLDDVKKHTIRIKDEAQQCLAARQAIMDQKVDDLPEKIVQMIYCRLASSPIYNFRANFSEISEAAEGSERQRKPKKAIASRNRPSKFTQDTVKAKNLLSLINYNSTLPPIHLQEFLQLGDILDEQSKARASAMIQSNKFRIWLTENDSSSSLLVNGHVDLGSAEGPSPLSFVSAELGEAAEETGSALVVKYFCSINTESMDPPKRSPPIDMMASLVGELLTQMLDRAMDVDLSFLSKKDLKNANNVDLDGLCIVFRELTMQLPPKTLLVCILDELLLFETETLEIETSTIMRRLTRLVAKHTEVVFKLLVTCQGQSLGFHKYFRDVDILDLDEDIEVDDSAIWSIKNMAGIKGVAES